jgi:RpiB/LacA/LacB family sugar-phosphate isomerase
LREAHYEVVDYGDRQPTPDDDYPDFVVPLARAVARGEVDRGVAICGSGVGACIAANKVPGVRACLIHEGFSARQGVEDDDMNVICLSHGWTMKFVQHRVGDPRILRLIQKWLKAGVVEDGRWSETKVGTPQGAVISPLLANIYLHYVFDLWVEVWRKKVATGDVVVVRYADDLVVGFEHRAEAERS